MEETTIAIDTNHADGPARAGEASACPNPRWRGSPQKSGSDRRKRSRLIFALTAVLLGGLGAVAGLVSLVEPSPSPYLLPIWATQSTQPNAGLHGPVLNDCWAIGSPRLFPNLAGQAAGNPSRALILQQLASLKSLPENQPLLVYVSAFAALDANAKVFLIPNNANPALPTNRLYLNQLLLELKQASSKRKLLVLDVSWPFAIPELEMFDDDVATRVIEELEQHHDPNLVCINSCSPGQTGTTIFSPRRTTFGYFFEQALLGAADGCLDGIANGRVSAREIANYLSYRVDDYSQQASFDRQTPTVQGIADDFDLIACSHNRLPPHDAQSVVSDTYPHWLLSSWELRDRIIDQEAWRDSPAFVREVENTILQAEMDWRRGEDSLRLSMRLESSLNSLASDFNQGRSLLNASLNPANGAQVIIVPQLASMAQAEQLPNTGTADAEQATNEKDDKQAGEQVGGSTNKKHSATDDKAPESKVASGSATRSTPPAPENTETQLAAVAPCDQEWLAYRLAQYLVDLATTKKVTPPKGWPAAESNLTASLISDTSTCKTSVFVDSVYQLVAETPGLTPWQIGTFVDLLDHRQIAPVNTKAAILREVARTVGSDGARLGETTVDRSSVDTESSWERTQRALRLIAESEHKLDCAEAWNWLASPRTAADNQRYVVERLFWFPDYVAPSAIDKLVRRATEQFDAVNALERRFASSYRALDLATWRLPQLSNCQDIFLDFHSGNQANQWVSASTLVEKLRGLLAPSQTQAVGENEHSAQRTIELARHVEHATITALELESLIKGLLGRYQQSQTDALIREAGEPSPSLVCLTHIIKQLQTPFSNSQTRLELHQAAVKLSQQKHRLALSNHSRPAHFRGSRLDQEELSRLALRSRKRSQTRKRFSDQIAKLQLCREFSVSSFQSKRKALEPYWQHLAKLYSKLGQDSPLADTYQGLAQQYRNQTSDSASTALRLKDRSVDGQLTFANRKSSHTIEYHQPSTNRRFSSTKFSSENRTKRPRTPTISVLPTPSRAISISGVLKANKSTVDFETELAPTANPATIIATKGYFVEFIEGGEPFLHRVELTGLSDEPAVELLVGQSLETATAKTLVRLRPSAAPHPMSLFIRNPGQETRELKVSAEHLTAAVTIPPGQTRRVVFANAPAKPGAPPAQTVDGFNIQVVDVATGEAILNREIEISVAAPHEYVRVTSAAFTPFAGRRNRLEVTLEATQPDSTQDCEVQLVLNPAQIPGLAGIEGGLLKGLLPRDGSPLTLYAENLKLDESSDEMGTFEIEVDGVERTFALATDFVRQGQPTTPSLITSPAIQIVAPPVGLAGSDFPLVLQTLNAPTGSRLNLELMRQGAQAKPDKQFKFPTPRNTKISVTPNPRGDLDFHVTVEDWAVKVDATGLNGPRRFVASLCLRNSIIGQDIAPVSLDDRPPRYVRFQNLPQRIAAATTHSLVVEAISETTGVESVQVFLGSPVDNAVPKKATLYRCQRLTDAGASLWGVEVPIPKEPAALAISVVAKNGAGLNTFETRTIEVVPAEALNVGDIAGQVFEGVRPQPQLDVLLYDLQGRVVAKTQSEFDGRFHFQEVRVGSYIVAAEKPAARRAGKIQCQALAGQISNADISLELR